MSWCGANIPSLKSITVITGGHLCHNPRVIKEASALHGAGHNVEVLGGWFDPALKARDLRLMSSLSFRFRPLHDLTEHPALRLATRIRGRIARMIHTKTGHESHWQLGSFVSALRKAAYAIKADLLIAHSEQALWAISDLPRSRFHIGLDMEDWFSENLPLEARRHRPVRLLRSMERMVLQSATPTTCTSKAMADALAKEYECRPPVPIYNVFPWADRLKLDSQLKDRKNRTVPSIHWYSQTLGMDRGLGDLFAALPLLNHEVEIHLRGQPVTGFEDWMSARLPEHRRNRVFVHGLVSNDELLSRIAEHDIGFAGEPKYCKNKEFTISNKILHYLLGGLGIVASDTAGHKEVAAKAPSAVSIFPSGDPGTLAAILNNMLGSPSRLAETKAASLRAAQTCWCWEKMAAVLTANIEGALATNSEHLG